MKTNYHTHTTRCHHATGSDEEFVLSAIKGGYQELGFSDHTPWKYHIDYISDIRMTPEELPEYVESIRALQEKYKDQISLKIGLECEYFPDYIGWLKEVIKEYRLDYIIFGNHHFHTDEKYLYFGRNTNTVEMLELYEKSAIEGMESGLFAYFAHPDLFMRSYPQFDQYCELISRNICRTAARLNLPLEYNINNRMVCNEKGEVSGYPCPEFWQIAVQERCTAIFGMDAHDNRHLENIKEYDIAMKELKQLGIKTIDRIPFLNGK
ncbi:histidinol-phosphatase [Bacteroides acidifaciens]|uniref:histidinol-phosphatase n=1 Tax=Bacteroides acidifaciens TaxID=85831 RepID=UPI0015892BDE|nr:histidinol-phosphatase [Bacteroides acidifaciens]